MILPHPWPWWTVTERETREADLGDRPFLNELVSTSPSSPPPCFCLTELTWASKAEMGVLLGFLHSSSNQVPSQSPVLAPQSFQGLWIDRFTSLCPSDQLLLQFPGTDRSSFLLLEQSLLLGRSYSFLRTSPDFSSSATEGWVGCPLLPSCVHTTFLLSACCACLLVHCPISSHQHH